MKRCPCRGCTRRAISPNCHDRCPVSEEGGYGYPEWRGERAARLHAERGGAEADGFLIGQQVKQKRKRNGRQGR